MALFKSIYEMSVRKITLFLKNSFNHIESVAVSVIPDFCLPGS